MKLNICEDYNQFMMLVCLFKVYRDAGIAWVYDKNSEYIINEYDYFYEYILEAVQCAAPIVTSDKKLYQKHKYDFDDDEAYIWAYSSKEMQEYYKIARKLHRLEGNGNKKNPYEEDILRKMKDIKGFESYDFDFFIGHKRKGARLEVLWGYNFMCEISMCLWIVRIMEMFKEELPKLKEKYRIAKWKKRSKPKHGGV